MKAKKADTMAFQVIIVLVILIVFALIYFFWLRDYRTSGENLSDYQICKSSNFEDSKLKLKAGNVAIQERSGNKCKTEYLTVPKDQELNFIARKLAQCWDMYLEGKGELFDTKDNNYCAICSVLTFEEDTELRGLTSYLMEEKVPWEWGKTYYEYLTRIIVTNEQVNTVKNEELAGRLGSIDTGTPQAVLFVEGKDINPESLTGQSSIVTGSIGGAVGAGLAGVIYIAGVGLCFTGIACPAGLFLVMAGGAIAGGTTGYLIGSDYDPDTDSRVLLWRYTNNELSQLQCTQLEGRERLDIRT